MKIAVYCGSGFGNNPVYGEAAVELGRWIGAKGHTLVYGGGDTGLMGIVAKEVHDSGRPVIGVVPSDVEFIASRPQPYCSEVIFTKDMSERKRKMSELADVFVALPGGIGTLDEISEVITLTKIGVFSKPSILFNKNGFYEAFKSLIATMEDSGFLLGEEMNHVLFASNVDEIEAFIK